MSNESHDADVHDPLEQLCQRALPITVKARQILTLPGRATPKAISEQLDTLSGRLSRAEVRILILGPLKAGKSTLMTVLTKNSSVSQIAEVPAYPVTIEVRDIDRSGDVSGEEASVFVRRDDSFEKPIPLAEGLSKLNRLLDDYIREGKSKDFEYKRVIQKIDFGAAAQRNVVLVDSPGLMFGDVSYSDATEALLRDSDFLLFVIRPEQLFFKNVRDYLEEFAQRAQTRRIFIMVNCSTRAETFSGKSWVESDQVEKRKLFQKFFQTHVAGERLNHELSKETDMSLLFADLLLVAKAQGGGQKAVSDCQSKPDSEVAVKVICDYIQGEDLAARKRRDIRNSLEEIVKDGGNFLGVIQSEAEDQVKQLRGRIAGTEKRISECDDQERKCEAKRTRVKDELKTIDAMIERLSLSRDGRNQEADDPCGEIASSGFKPDFVECLRDQIPSDAELGQHVGKVYDSWKDGDLGAKHLFNLSRVVWSHRVRDDRDPLDSRYSALVDKAYQLGLQSARQEAAKVADSTSYLSAALQWMPPTIRFEPNIPSAVSLLEFSPKKTIWPPHWVGYNATDLWGKDSRKLIHDNFGDTILAEQRKSFVGLIVGDPWALKDFFSLSHLLTVARDNFIRLLRPLLQREAIKERGKSEQSLSEIDEEIDGIAEKRSLASEEKRQDEQHLVEQQERVSDVAKRVGELEELRQSSIAFK